MFALQYLWRADIEGGIGYHTASPGSSSPTQLSSPLSSSSNNHTHLALSLLMGGILFKDSIMNRQTIEEPRRSARLAALNVENEAEESNSNSNKNRVGRFELVSVEDESSPRDDNEELHNVSSSFPIDVATISLDRCKYA